MEDYQVSIWEELVGRQSGPLHFRILLQPIVATFLAIRAGRNDARLGNPEFLRVIIQQPRNRPHLLRQAWSDVGILFLVGIALDIIYQVITAHGLQLSSAIIVAIVLAFIPYAIVRSLTNHVLK